MHRNLAQPVELGAKCGDFAALAGKIEFPPWPIPIPPLLKREIVDAADGSDPLRQHRGLMGRRIEAIDMGLADQHLDNLPLVYA